MKEGKYTGAFYSDYYRMTGEEYTGSFHDRIQLFTRHNIRYMYWWRKRSNPIIGKIARIMLFRYSRKYGLELGGATIGEGLYLGHPYNITVGEDVIIGKNVNLHKGVTIGRENRGKRCGSPVIGNNVFIGINATVIGNIKVGNDVMIAPNSFVNFDVPDHSIVIGNPATVHFKKNATEKYVGFTVGE